MLSQLILINNFRFLLRQANALGYYDPVNYSNKPINYCGIKVTNNPIEACINPIYLFFTTLRIRLFTD